MLTKAIFIWLQIDYSKTSNTGIMKYFYNLK